MPRMKAMSRKRLNRVKRVTAPYASPYWRRSQLKRGVRVVNIVSKRLAIIDGRPTGWYIMVSRSKGPGQGIGLVKARWYLPYVRLD